MEAMCAQVRAFTHSACGLMSTTRSWQVLESKGADRARKQALARARKEVLAGYAYPRLDVEVSKKMNHLLKAPFCVHPKTGKVGVGALSMQGCSSP